jgi:hypothetical protein
MEKRRKNSKNPKIRLVVVVVRVVCCVNISCLNCTFVLSFGQQSELTAYGIGQEVQH